MQGFGQWHGTAKDRLINAGASAQDDYPHARSSIDAMSLYRRLVAWVLAPALILQLLQGSAAFCTPQAMHPSTTASAISKGMHHQPSALRALTASMHRGTGQTIVSEAPNADHGQRCPDRDAPQSCVTMTGCAQLVAAPLSNVASTRAITDASVLEVRLTRPAAITRAPELPPPRA